MAQISIRRPANAADNSRSSAEAAETVRQIKTSRAGRHRTRESAAQPPEQSVCLLFHYSTKSSQIVLCEKILTNNVKKKLELCGEYDTMLLRFSNKAKKLKKAWETNDFHLLVVEYDVDTAECLADVLDLLNTVRNLHDMKQFSQYRPHTIENGSIFSLSLVGRKRLTVKTLDNQGKPMKKVDFSATGSIILEVTEHYGD